MTDGIAQCSTCRFFKAGRCHRYAPRPHPKTSRMDMAVWPNVSEAQWCGEYLPNKKNRGQT